MAIKITIQEQVHVDIRIDGETIDQDLTAGDHLVEDAVGELLIAQGIATIAVDAPTKTTKKTESTPKETPEA